MFILFLRNALIEASKLAGFSSAQFISDPVAAVLAYGLDTEDPLTPLKEVREKKKKVGETNRDQEKKPNKKRNKKIENENEKILSLSFQVIVIDFGTVLRISYMIISSGIISVKESRVLQNIQAHAIDQQLVSKKTNTSEK